MANFLYAYFPPITTTCAIAMMPVSGLVVALMTNSAWVLLHVVVGSLLVGQSTGLWASATKRCEEYL